jgi:Dynamin family
MASELEELRRASAELAQSAHQQRELSARAERLADRLGAGRFHVSVLGEFKRGKSTFLNALLGERVLPTGVVPVTAIGTELAYGEPGTTVFLLDGSLRQLGPDDDLADYVTEAGNPNNARQVRRVEVRVCSPLLQPGLVLVDTPGLGSIHLHNDETARQALTETDGAVLVLSADAALSERERDVVRTLAERGTPTFFVLNKADHLSGEEVEEVRRFVTKALATELGSPPRLWCVAALPALRARQAGGAPGAESGELGLFEAELRRFLEADLLGARLVTARRELERLAQELNQTLDLTAGALRLDAAVLRERVATFRAAGATEHQALADERVLLGRDVATLTARLGRELQTFARRAPQSRLSELEQVAASAPWRHLDEELRQAVEAAVREDFDRFRMAEASRVEEEWRRTADRFRARTEERVNTLRSLAAQLFEVPVPTVRIPELAEERERFFYLFFHVGTTTEGLSRLAGWLLPRRLYRRRMGERAKRHLADELDKHAGRARWDISQRLDAVRRRFEVEMLNEVDGTLAMVVEAAARAEELRRQAASDEERRQQEDAAARRAADKALALCAADAR